MGWLGLVGLDLINFEHLMGESGSLFTRPGPLVEKSWGAEAAQRECAARRIEAFAPFSCDRRSARLSLPIRVWLNDIRLSRFAAERTNWTPH
jgi:hypothetical protein